MWSSGSLGLESVDLALDHQPMLEPAPTFQPSPYIFTKLENGKKKATDASCVPPPSWLLLDHAIAVIWSMFNMDPKLQPLTIDDLKWAYEFLKEIKNQKGANPPDVKVCLQEIEDRLIHLYSQLTCSEPEDSNELDNASSDDVTEKSTTSYINTSFFSKDIETKFDSLSLSNKSLSLVRKSSSRHLKPIEKEEISPRVETSTVGGWFKKKVEEQTPLEDFAFLEVDSDWGEEEEMDHNEEVEKYVLRLFENEKKEEALQAKHVTKSLIPTVKKKTGSMSSDMVSNGDGTKKEKTSKNVHCIAQMRSLQFQKSMKVKNTNGEQAAYSKLKAEIFTIKPNPSKDGVMKILKKWRSEQVHNQHKKVRCLEEYMKSVNHELKPSFHTNYSLGLKDKEKYSPTRRY